MEQNNLNINIDLTKTTTVEPESGKVWAQGVILRKVSKFVTGTHEDALIPIPVFYDPSTGQICLDTLPKEIREEYK